MTAPHTMTRSVTTWTLAMTQRPAQTPADTPLPDGVRVELAAGMTPEYARFLYGIVGGPWLWVDRLAWSREEWARDLAVPGTETWVATKDGVPVGFVQLQPTPPGPTDDGDTVEIRYFGIVTDVIGQGLGSALLVRGLDAAWTLAERHDLPATTRVWVHTCSLDGPAALDNYRARGFSVIDETTADETGPAQPLGAWAATGGPT